MDEPTKALENATRRHAARLGVILQKSRAKRWSIDNMGGYRLIDKSTGRILAGEKYEMTFDAVQDLLGKREGKLRRR